MQLFTELLEAPDARLIVIHGQSGVGKSSFLLAGVIPHLEHGGYRVMERRSGMEGWPVEGERAVRERTALWPRARDRSG